WDNRRGRLKRGKRSRPTLKKRRSEEEEEEEEKEGESRKVVDKRHI
ncbi:hypothetical protein L195_g063312, partial [Trifolium pratense]